MGKLPRLVVQIGYLSGTPGLGFLLIDRKLLGDEQRRDSPSLLLLFQRWQWALLKAFETVISSCLRLSLVW